MQDQFIKYHFQQNYKIYNLFYIIKIIKISWSSDSRMFVSASKDSTLKVWDIKTKKLMFDLPGNKYITDFF